MEGRKAKRQVSGRKEGTQVCLQKKPLQFQMKLSDRNILVVNMANN
jgi:hypothetical protein